MRKFLNFFSYVLHPLFIPLLTVICFFLLDENFLSIAERILFIIQVFILTVLIPIAFYFLLRTTGLIHSVMASSVKERIWPLLAQVVLLWLLLRRDITYDQMPELYYFFASGMLTTIVALFFLFGKIKVSLHMAAISAMLTFFIGLSLHNQQNYIYPIASLFMLTGLVASSRLQMEAHTNGELIVGFLCGMSGQMALWGFWL